MSEKILKEILGELKTINQRVGGLEDGQQRLESGQQKLETRIGSLENGQKELISDVSDLKEGQQKLEARMESLETGQQKLETRMDSLEKGQIRLEARMESEVIEKIGALFDGNTLEGGQIENLQKHLDKQLDSIEIDTGYLVSRVARSEKLAK